MGVLQSDEQTNRLVVLMRGDPRTPESSRRDGALASLAATPMAGRFCAWRGASDRRYVASVYQIDRSAQDAGLPAFDAFILMAVARGNLGRRILEVATIERASDRRAVLASALSCGADEWHVHLLAEDRRERASMVADLRTRHCRDTAEARCA